MTRGEKVHGWGHRRGCDKEEGLMTIYLGWARSKRASHTHRSLAPDM